MYPNQQRSFYPPMAVVLPSDDNANTSPPQNEQSTQQQPQATQEQQQSTQPALTTQQIKCKPSRRANTAERRATHNAAERQRRETLNGRFLVSFFFRLHSFDVLKILIGPSRPPPKPISNPASLSILHRQLFHSAHPCITPAPPPRCPRTARS